MDLQELRNLQEAYLSVYSQVIAESEDEDEEDEDEEEMPKMNGKKKGKKEKEEMKEGYKDLPTDKMRGKVIKHAASGTKRAFLSKFKGQKGTTAGNVEDAKAIKSLNKAKKIQGEIEKKEKMGSDFYQGSREGRALANRRKGQMKEGYDFFDVILEHLVAEGYADTNEAALAIMANMSEEWKQSIVEGDALRNTVKKLEAKRDAMNREKPGSANTAAPGKQSVGAATYKAYQRLRGV